MPPTVTEVSRRLAALKVVCLYALHAPPRSRLAELSRGWSESEKNDFAAKANEERDAYWKRVKDAGLWGELTPNERVLAATTVATMTAKQQIDTAWRVEAVAVLLWALKARDTIPGYDTPVEHEIVNVTVPEGAELRAEGELQAARAVAELWHWRSRTREAAERGTPLSLTPQMKSAGVKTYDDLVRTAAAGAHQKGHIAALVDGDFAVNGKAFRALSPGEWAAVRSMAEERRHALDWLTGRAPGNRWDDAPAQA
jgi:hypothetical protein